MNGVSGIWIVSHIAHYKVWCITEESGQTMKSVGWDNKHLLTQHYIVNNLFCMKKVQNLCQPTRALL